MSAASEAGPLRRTAFLAETELCWTINDFPEEVIGHIFEFLPYPALRNARLVCRKWYSASLAPQLLKRDGLLCQQNGQSRRIRHIPKSLFNSTRQFRHIYIKGACHGDNDMDRTSYCYHWTTWFDQFNESFWTKFGPNFRSVKFAGCTIHTDELFKVLSYCPDLKDIRIENCTLIIGNQFSEGDDEDTYEDMPPLLNTNPLVYDRNNDDQYFDGRDELFQQILSRSPTVKSIFIKFCFW